MNLRFEEDLVEAAVTLAASGGLVGVPSLQVARFHRERERLYAILDGDDRNAAFFKLHLEWFREWEMERLLTQPLKSFPLLSPSLRILAYRKSRLKNDEGAELYVNGDGERSGVLCLRPERLRSGAELEVFLYHELMHLHDMVSPDFGYRAELAGVGLSPSQQRAARERYRVLWDVSIDGRLSHTGRKPATTREARLVEFSRGFQLWPKARQAEVFERLWSDPNPTHAEIESWITEHARLRCTEGPNPGAPCPLCGFPTFAWASMESVKDEVLDAVRHEFPAWNSEQGLCRRCAEVYRAAAIQAVVVT
jgi:hypothetical protein